MTTARTGAIILGVAITLAVALTLAFAGLFGRPGDAPAQVPKPNVVLILADDLGWGDVACFNRESKIPTPHLDKLAAQGVRFTDAHSSSGVCVPSRFSIMTGRHAFRLVSPQIPEAETRARYGGNQPTKPLVPADCPTPAGVLAKAGYATSMIGKWHLGFDDLLRRPGEPLRGGPTDRGFDRYYGIPSSLDIDPYVFIDGDRVVAQATEKMPAHASPGWPDPRMGEFWRDGIAAPGFRHAAVLPELTRRAEGELRRLATDAKRRPFFFYYALPSPHSPLVPAREFLGRAKAASLYEGYVAQTDDAIGRVLRVLDEAGAAEGTLVIVTSDNGPFWYPENVERTGHAAAGPWRGMKGDAWEGGHRVPFIARWPGQAPAGKVCDATVSLTDLLATVASVAGVPQEAASSDGIDISPAIRGEAWDRPADRRVVVRSSHGFHVLRSGRWVYIDRLGSGGFSRPAAEKAAGGGPAGQLFDLVTDPGQRHNLAASRPEQAKELQRQLAELLATRK